MCIRDSYNGDNAEEKTKMAQAMNLLMPGNAFLYYGVEIGMRGTANDETKRLAMRWSGDSKAKGMCAVSYTHLGRGVLFHG